MGQLTIKSKDIWNQKQLCTPPKLVVVTVE
uniref:Uncharacterized protein n=1 Tax=Myoviridae sp. ctPoO4 TaxID=2827685 RepID=A0A8S5SNB8_9CAUD|nr:MAG TPA: hypothetical protein [Myoviridae sp. ctPoO4]